VTYFEGVLLVFVSADFFGLKMIFEARRFENSKYFAIFPESRIGFSYF
jgi:hypothetical protein